MVRFGPQGQMAGSHRFPITLADPVTMEPVVLGGL